MSVRMKLVTLSLALGLLGLLILPIPVSAQQETWYSITIEGAISCKEFQTLSNAAGTRFKTRKQLGGYLYVTVDLNSKLLSDWLTHASFGASPGAKQSLDRVYWIFHHMDVNRKSLEGRFVLRYEGPSGFDIYTVRFVLHVSGKGVGEYTDGFADVYISHYAEIDNPDFPPGPRRLSHHHGDHSTGSITVSITEVSP